MLIINIHDTASNQNVSLQFDGSGIGFSLSSDLASPALPEVIEHNGEIVVDDLAILDNAAAQIAIPSPNKKKAKRGPKSVVYAMDHKEIEPFICDTLSQFGALSSIELRKRAAKRFGMTPNKIKNAHAFALKDLQTTRVRDSVTVKPSITKTEDGKRYRLVN